MIYKMNELISCPHCLFNYEKRINHFVVHKFAIGYIPTIWECNNCRNKFIVIRQNGYYEVLEIESAFYNFNGDRLIEKDFNGKILMDIEIDKDIK